MQVPVLRSVAGLARILCIWGSLEIRDIMSHTFFCSCACMLSVHSEYQGGATSIRDPREILESRIFKGEYTVAECVATYTEHAIIFL